MKYYRECSPSAVGKIAAPGLRLGHGGFVGEEPLFKINPPARRRQASMYWSGAVAVH